MLRNTLINFTLKLGLALSLIYTGLEAIIVPDNVLVYWPEFLTSSIHDSILILITSAVCFGLIAWIFSNKGPFTSAMVCSSLVGVVGIVNIMDVPFLIDIAPLFFISVALSLRYYPRIRVVAQTKVTPLANITTEAIPEKRTETVIESDIHTEHDQHIFVPKQ